MNSQNPQVDILLGAYRPMTDHIGFVNAPLDKVVSFCNAWLCPQGRDPAEEFRASFDEAMQRMLPPDRKILLIECKSGWTSLFGDTVSYISEELHCRGVEATYIEDTYNPKMYEGEMGSVQLQVFEQHPTDSHYYGRSISVTNDEGRWGLHLGGDPLPFEDVTRYKARRVRDRFTKEMLIEYLQGFGIDAYNRSFYTDRCALFPPAKQTYFGDELRINGHVIRKDK